MTTDENTSLTPIPSGTSNYKTELQAFETGLMAFIAQHGLPTQNVLVSVPERVEVFDNVESVLALLDP